jgi:hypothetical protein
MLVWVLASPPKSDRPGKYAVTLIAEARLQATDDFRFEAAHMIRRFLSQPTMNRLAMIAPRIRPTISPTRAATVMVMATPHRTEISRHRSSYDLGSITDLILRLASPPSEPLMFDKTEWRVFGGKGVHLI